MRSSQPSAYNQFLLEGKTLATFTCADNGLGETNAFTLDLKYGVQMFSGNEWQ
ncbi:MAG: hypothetical protein ACI9LX_000894 [Paraglaciecola sp.]|jgi:hypothetical protein